MRTLFSLENHETNIDEVGGKRRSIGTYSSGVKMTLKVRLTPMETTLSLKNKFENETRCCKR